MLNGKLREIQDGTSVSSLLEEMKFKNNRVVVEINLKIVPKKEYDNTKIADGDRVEVLCFVGGG